MSELAKALPLAVNPITGVTYSGGNQDELTGVFIVEQHKTNEWCTYRQAQDHGGQVRKGEKSTSCRKAGVNDVTDKETGTKSKKRYIKGFNVFNFDQIDWENGGPTGSDDWSTGERIISDDLAVIKPQAFPQT